MIPIYRRPHGISGDGDAVIMPLYGITNAELEQTAIVASTASQGTLTLSANVSNNDTVLIDEDIDGTLTARTYKFVTSLTASTTENEVLIGAAATNSIDNFIEAINGTGSSGTNYGSETPRNLSVSAAVGAGDTMVATARRPGATGDTIATTKTSATASWDAATLGTTTAGVNGDVLVRIDGGLSFGLTNAPTTQDGVRRFIPDEFELLGRNTVYVFEDAAAKAWADEVLIIETTDHPSANHPDGALFAGTATSVTASTLVAEASEDGIAHPLSADVNTVDALVIFIESATTGAGQTVQLSSFVHSTRVFTLLNNWPLTPTGTIVYKIYSSPSRVPAQIFGSNVASLDVALGIFQFHKNALLEDFSFVMRNTTGALAVGADVTGQISKDGGAFVGITAAIAEIGSTGVYQMTTSPALLASEMNADHIVLKFTSPGAVATVVDIWTRPE